MGNNCPEITISDNKESLNLNDMYKKFYTSDKNTSKFTIGDFDFDTISIRLYETETRNVIAYTSNRRVITSENIGKSIETLNGKIKDGNDSYYYNLIVSGKYLDENIHPSQMEFSIPEEYDENGDFFDVSNPSFSQIRSECLETVKKELSGYLEVSTNNKKEKLIDYVKNHKPGYRVLIDRIKNKKFPFDRLPNNPNMQEMELFLHNLKFQEEKELLALRNKLKKSTKLNEKTKQTYDEAMRKYIAKSSGINTCELSNYITDITSKIEAELIDVMGYQKSPDGDGFFKYHPLEGCMVSLEIITYEKMFNDARKKNEIFFRILGLN